MDRLTRSDLITHLTGRIFLTQCDALNALAPDITAATMAATRTETTR